ncbi:hypothetical protein L13192_03935 [Pyrenophora tritici-repentis]|uniref:Uncharacterized protein n=2 Tax=Pyrenophora tritici-repentis TaxID=45151 RepID=A0A922NDU3_9PLEO|nr:uncharacterized protein PTRG_11230 [Pyrenophora tritici-repentis Pt-1C-BFP]EDU44280.1 conserved hypothetical protein [Pyrenophora tritici-repentis Pt-1C-BFP]KAI1514713.1 hypothetical protein Ptr86124_006036 [Pyrenophora tritici-repentis]KAI1673076.1 hypothetical protein L13192_03935 [Pyrenophora tritici-repentis]KAI1677091.1 hypothetical protein KJE20_13180 [Pyrenophora tritici-repentis]
MADKIAPILMDLPLEVRHAIFKYVAARDVEPRKLLRYWLEKKEVKALIAQEMTNNPNAPTPQAVYSDHEEYEVYFHALDSEFEDEDDEDDEDEDDDMEDFMMQLNEDEDEDSDEAEQEFHDEDDEEAEADLLVYGDYPEAEEEEENATIDGTHQILPSTITFHFLSSDPAQVETIEQTTANVQAADELEKEAEEVTGQDNSANVEDMQVDVDQDEDEDMNEEDGGTDAATTPAQPPPQGTVIRPHRKWRHVPKFMRLTQCPPPVELLLTCQELNNEAKNWFYDVATLRIDATGSFAHTSFFEETFSQITDAAFSPMKNIRKVEVTFVWDSTWIRADTAGCVGAIFPALLGQRSSFVHRILLMAPDLKEVVIHWHDSAHDDESVSLMLDTLAPFHTLPATILIHEHYIPADARPNKRSTAGKRRVEFQNILDMGLDRLF